MITAFVRTAADVIHRAQVNGTQTSTGLAIALESAQLLQSPGTATELADLRARRDVLLSMLPTEPLPAVMLGEGPARRAVWQVWEQVAGVLGVSLPYDPTEASAVRLAALLAPSEAGEEA